MSDKVEERRISRRTIAKGAAWAVPIVPLVVATPAYASSGGGPVITVGDACKLPGNSCGNVFVKGYIFDVTISNPTNEDIYLFNEDPAGPASFLITFTETNPDINLFFQAAVDAVTGTVISFPYLLEAGSSLVIILNAGENGSSANESITGTISVPWGHTLPAGSDPDNHPPAVDGFTFPDTPPVQNPSCGVTIPPNCGKKK